nr:MAG TPA: Protein of unknown function (DUF2735) [Caudoviricetes sp.]
MIATDHERITAEVGLSPCWYHQPATSASRLFICL